MPWVPIKYQLRKMRERHGWTVQDVAEKTKLSDQTLYNLPSRSPPSFVQPDTAQKICEAFDLKLSDFNKWAALDRWILWVPHAKGDDVDIDDVHIQQTTTLAKLAKMERDLGLHAATIVTSAGPVELLGLERLKRVFATPKHEAEHRKMYAVCGKIDQYESMPSSVAKRIGADDGAGAIFRVTRAVAKRLPLYVSVFCPDGETTQRLMSAYDAGERVALLVRVVFDPYKGPWRGFFFIEEGSKAKKFAFIVDKFVTETKGG
jgi:transcriptional regulator with XRE-family HTH domain